MKNTEKSTNSAGLWPLPEKFNLLLEHHHKHNHKPTYDIIQFFYDLYVSFPGIQRSGEILIRVPDTP